MTSHQPKSSWQPILTAIQTEQATEAIRAIAEALRQLPSEAIPAGMPDAYRDSSHEPLLARGKAGQALFCAYLSEAFPSAMDRERAFQLLDQAVCRIAEAQSSASLFAGFTGVAWAVEHLQQRLGHVEQEDSNEEVDKVLKAYLKRRPWEAEYDLVYGLVGFGVYSLARLARASAVGCLQEVVSNLEELAEHDSAGVTWRSAPESLLPHQRTQNPAGYFNLGVAHGVPGVIAMLGRTWAADVAREKIEPLLDGAIRWMLSQKLPEGSDGSFPYWVGPGTSPAPARLAWCYGDAGIATALLLAARSLHRSDWEREALAIGRQATKRPLETSAVVDAGLCHGAAGLGHLFNRLYHATRDEEFAEAARSWFARALAMRRSDQGLAGFSAWIKAPDGEDAWVADPSLLTGAAGIGLALLAATTPIEPAWDQILLASIPPLVRETTVGNGNG